MRTINGAFNYNGQYFEVSEIFELVLNPQYMEQFGIILTLVGNRKHY